MKKNGKKARRLAKEKQERRIIEEKRARKPYSRVSKGRKLCAHYRTIEGDIVRISGYSIIVGTGWSYLYPISESKCRCRVCKMEFTIEQYHAMQAFIVSYPSQECKTLDSAHAEIQKIVPPVGYYELGEDSVKTVPLAEGEVVIPRIVLSSDGLRYYMESENLKSKNLRVEKRVVEGPC